MYFLDNWHKFVFVGTMCIIYSVGWSFFLADSASAKVESSLQQLNEDVVTKDRQAHLLENNAYPVGWAMIGLVTFLIFIGDLRKMFKSLSTVAVMLLVFSCTGCWRPFEPIKLEVIGSNEEAFLLPYLGDSKKQTSSDNETYLKENLVFTKQIKIPQQWVSKGYEYMGANGVWQDAAILIKVDKSPVTREWTADTASGTSNKNEAIWVMTSDQVEFSTGWTITARIASREDAIKFLHNYPNGTLEKVLDSEVRSKLQAVFGLEVTDLPMSKLREAATPHILTTTKEVITFFSTRGITITNLGISGGFVYKDPSILATMVKVFNAEQQKSVSAAENAAQEALNLKALSIKETEASGIKLVADAKFYELEKTHENLADYLHLKQLELQKELITKWDGRYPSYYMVGGKEGSNPAMMLQLPPIEEQKKEVK